MHGVPVGERKKFSQRSAPRKGSKVRLSIGIVERIRCPEGSQKSAKKAFTDWHSSFHVLPQKWALAILGPREQKRRGTKSETTFNEQKPKVLEIAERAKRPKTELAAKNERKSDKQKRSPLGRRKTSLK